MLKRIPYILFLLFASVGISLAQQDPQYSQYMFNQLVINPGYTGSKEALSAVADLRQQDRKSTRLNSSHIQKSRMPSSA